MPPPPFAWVCHVCGGRWFEEGGRGPDGRVAGAIVHQRAQGLCIQWVQGVSGDEATTSVQ